MLFVTIWAALALFVVAEAGKGPLATDGRPPRWARPAWIAGALLAIVHAVIAFAVRYQWDHDAAVLATAAQAAEIYGAAWRGSLYVNYVFLALWLLAAWSWRHWAWRMFVVMMIGNGAIVFARPAARPVGAVLVAVLCWAWWPRRWAGCAALVGRHDTSRCPLQRSSSLRAWISAQVIAPERIDPPITISSNDIAFRVEARRGNRVEGRLLVRMDGEWVEADVDGGLRVLRLQTK